jgi:hypothetical protein
MQPQMLPPCCGSCPNLCAAPEEDDGRLRILFIVALSTPPARPPCSLAPPPYSRGRALLVALTLPCSSPHTRARTRPHTPAMGELDLTLGAVEIGIILATMAYGMTIVQSHSYANRCGQDPLWMKLVVLFLGYVRARGTQGQRLTPLPAGSARLRTASLSGRTSTA